MITLYGITPSNYTNMVKLALIEKDISFREIKTMPCDDLDVLSASPMGKVPYIEVDGCFLSETNVIYDYLEDLKPEPALYPADALSRAKIKEIIRTAELYLDAPARRHLPAVIFGEPVNQDIYKDVKPAIEKGLRAFKQLARFGPYIAGSEFTFADIACYFHLRFVNLHTIKIYDWDITDTFPELDSYLVLLSQRRTIKALESEMQKAIQELMV